MKRLFLAALLALLNSNAAAESHSASLGVRVDFGGIVESFWTDPLYDVHPDSQWYNFISFVEGSVGARLYDTNGSLITTIQDLPRFQIFNVEFAQAEFFQVTPSIVNRYLLVLGSQAQVPSDFAFYECSQIEDSYELSAFKVVVNYSLLPTPVPEPETYAMLGIGLGVLGAVARRRKSIT